jgi:phage terminase small subunit
MSKKTKATEDLTDKRIQFCHEYMVDLNGKQAAIRAGYPERCAHSQAAQLLSIPKVRDYIDELLRQRRQATQIDAAYVQDKLVAMSEADITDIRNADGSFKPLDQWPAIWRKMARGLEFETVVVGRGKNQKVITVIKKLSVDKLLSIMELIGKLSGVGAFKEQIEASGEVKVKITYEDETE